MASIISKLAEWLAQYDGLSITPTPDLMRADIEAAGLFRSPDGVRTTFVDGSADVTDFFLFTVRRSALTDSDRADTEEWMEGLSGWITRRTLANDLPVLDGGRTCWAVHPSGSFSMPSETDTDAIWQLSIEISYFDSGNAAE